MLYYFTLCYTSLVTLHYNSFVVSYYISLIVLRIVLLLRDEQYANMPKGIYSYATRATG